MDEDEVRQLSPPARLAAAAAARAVQRAGVGVGPADPHCPLPTSPPPSAPTSQDYGFEYEGSDNEEDVVDVENEYYTAKCASPPSSPAVKPSAS